MERPIRRRASAAIIRPNTDGVSARARKTLRGVRRNSSILAGGVDAIGDVPPEPSIPTASDQVDVRRGRDQEVEVLHRAVGVEEGMLGTAGRLRPADDLVGVVQGVGGAIGASETAEADAARRIIGRNALEVRDLDRLVAITYWYSVRAKIL